MINFINNKLSLIISVLATIITFISGYIGNLYKNHINDRTKKQIVEDTVKYVEQITKDSNINSNEKFKQAEVKALEWLNEKGIKVSKTELEILIESAVHTFNILKK